MDLLAIYECNPTHSELHYHVKQCYRLVGSIIERPNLPKELQVDDDSIHGSMGLVA